MRLRNIPRAERVLTESPLVIKQPETLKGRWQTELFHNDHPIHIEIGMGKGQFILELSKRNPDINYIGIERYSSVLLRAVEKIQGIDSHAPQVSEASAQAVDEHPNLRFLCMDAADLSEIFAPGEVDRIYLNFSDPWPKARHARRRLTSSEYFNRYDKVLARGGQVEFKTDNFGLFDFSVETLEESDCWSMIECTRDLHHHETMNDGNIMTEYEAKFSAMNHPICKLIAKRSADISE